MGLGLSRLHMTNSCEECSMSTYTVHVRDLASRVVAMLPAERTNGHFDWPELKLMLH